MDEENLQGSHQKLSISSKDGTKSSWIKSLKRSFTRRRKRDTTSSSLVISDNDVSNNINSERLNKSDWDIRNSEDDQISVEGNSLNIGRLSISSGLNAEGNSKELKHRHYYTIDARRLASRHKSGQFSKQLLTGMKQFNLNPKVGLKYLEDKSIIKMTAESVALFLFDQNRLSKKQIGAYLGGREKFQQDVLLQFVKLHEFSNLLLVQALRQFLWSFRLPGEAQQIDRVMSVFALHYWEQNVGVFSSSDSVYILAFSIIMLNTALHNKNVKTKISIDQFVKQNKGIDGGNDLPKEMLEAIYKNIREQPFKIPDETYDDLMFTFFDPMKEGWLIKQGGSWKNWKRRWFVLNDRCLYYFQHTAETVPKGMIPLENVSVRPILGDGDKKWQFEIKSNDKDVVKGCKTDKHGAIVIGNHTAYKMVASSEQEMLEWIKCIEDSIEDHPVRKFYTKKKEASRRPSNKNDDNCVIEDGADV